MEQEITFEVLDAISYGKPLKAKFEDLGIGHIWKSGKRKADLINAGLKELANMKATAIEEMTETEAVIKINDLELGNSDEKFETVKFDEEKSDPKLVDETIETINPKFSKMLGEVKLEKLGEHNLPKILVDIVKAKEVKSSDGVENLAFKHLPKSDSAKEAHTDNLEEMYKPKYSEEIVDKNLKLISANLKNAIKAQRLPLLKKKAMLLEMKEWYNKQ